MRTTPSKSGTPAPAKKSCQSPAGGGGVSSVAVSPDGKRIVAGTWDKAVKVWAAADGKELLTLAGHAENVPCVAVSPDGTRIASGSGDKTVRLWDAKTGAAVATFEAAAPVAAVAFTPDGRRVVAGAGKTVCVWAVGK